MKRTLLLVAAVALLTSPVRFEAQSAVSESRLRAHVTTLASERLEGRLAGSAGERLAGEYIAGELKRMGARPLPGRSDYRLPFEFTAGTKDAGTSVSVGSPTAGSKPDPKWKAQALSFSDTGEVTGPVVFAGYGLVVPDSQDFGYDSYATLDVKDKIVLVLRYFPEDADPKTKAILARYAGLRFKAMAARQRGAKAMLVVTGPRSPNAGELVPITFDTALAGSGIVAASVTGAVADRLFEATGKTLESAQAALDSANPHVAGFAIPNVQVTVKTALGTRAAHRLQHRRLSARNGRCEGRQALGGHRRALRSFGPRRSRQLTRHQCGNGPRPLGRRRQRVGHGRGVGPR